ncbi:MAG: hypothetical protein WKG07_36220 [Hymenobacter sp.]
MRAGGGLPRPLPPARARSRHAGGHVPPHLPARLDTMRPRARILLYLLAGQNRCRCSRARASLPGDSLVDDGG